jgi:rhodanese-related sulfurtransferase
VEERLVTVTAFVDEGLGNSSYLVEIGDRRGLVVDPPRDIRPFLAPAADQGISLSHSLETHLHADFVSGSRELAKEGAEILAPRDARLGYVHTALNDGPIAAFATGHVPGSVSIELRPAFASWLGWLVPIERPIVFVAAPEQDRRELVRQALGIGYERLEGELGGGVETWVGAGRSVATTGLVTTIDLHRKPLVDVRQSAEYRAGHVPGPIPIELGAFVDPALGSLPADAAFMCGHGKRAMTAASLAERSGHAATVLLGGPQDWARQTGGSLARE